MKWKENKVKNDQKRMQKEFFADEKKLQHKERLEKIKKERKAEERATLRRHKEIMD